MSCILRVHKITKVSDLDCRKLGLSESRSGFLTAEVSAAGFDNLELQIADAIAYLERNGASLASLSLESSIDFGIAKRPVSGQFETFPAALLKLIGELGIDLVVSIYEVAEDAA